MKEGYYDKSFNILLLIVDIFGIIISFYIAFSLRFTFDLEITSEFYTFMLLCIILWIIVSFYNKIYQLSKLRSLQKSASNLLYMFLIHVLLISLSFVSLKVQDTYVFPRLFLIYFYCTAFSILFIIRLLYYFGLKYYYASNQFNTINLVIVGSGSVARKLYQGFQNEIKTGSNYCALGYFDDKFDEDSISKELQCGRLEELQNYCLQNKVNEIYYTLELTDKQIIDELTSFADENFIYLRFVPDFAGFQKSKVSISFFNSIPIVEYTQAPLGGYLNQRIKRVFDVLFASFVIVFIYPFTFPIISMLIKLESKGPVIFKQLRPGKGNELFECYKFRTMKVNTITEKQASKNDPRITRIGGFLRKSSLDEFPQFLNVLQGKMSIVGPRPNLISQLEFYSKEIDKYRFRHFITPGITGWAQVNGFRGETEEISLMKKRVEYDAWYIENWSLSLDVKIIFMTILKLFVGDKRAY